MSVHEYIGARYVPIFGRVGEESIEWDNTKPYEPLTIVLYQGNSYTSRQYVPVGVDITNEIYWAETGNYNAQVEQYRREVLTFDNRITANTDNIAAEKTNREEADLLLQDQIDEFENIVDTLYGNIKKRDVSDTSYLYSNPPAPTWAAIQGVCYTENGRYAGIFSPSLQIYRTTVTPYLNTCVIKEFNANGSLYRQSNPIICGHGNGLTFNSKTREFVIANNYLLAGDAAETRSAVPRITRVNYADMEKINDINIPEIGSTINAVSYDSESDTLMVFNSDDWKAAYLNSTTYQFINIIDISVFSKIYDNTVTQFDASRRQSLAHNSKYIVMSFYMPNMFAFVRRENLDNLIKITHEYNFHDAELEGFDIDNNANIIYGMHKRYYNRSVGTQECVTNIYTIYESNYIVNSNDSEWIEGSAVSASRFIDVNPATTNVIQNGSVSCPCKSIMEAFWIANSRESLQPIEIRIQAGATGRIPYMRISDFRGKIQDNSNGNVEWVNSTRITNSMLTLQNIHWVEASSISEVPYPFSNLSGLTTLQSLCYIINCVNNTNDSLYVDQGFAYVYNSEIALNVTAYRNSLVQQ